MVDLLSATFLVLGIAIFYHYVRYDWYELAEKYGEKHNKMLGEWIERRKK